MEHYNRYLKQVESKIGNTTTSESTLDKLGRRLFKGEWDGVFPADAVKIKRYGIANFDETGETGSHWIAIVKTNNKYIFYDSFGRADWDDDAEQDTAETNCGQRCLAWLLVAHNHGIEKALTI